MTNQGKFFLGNQLDPSAGMPRAFYVAPDTNPHFMAVGSAGSGKTKTIQSLIVSMTQNLPGSKFYFACGRGSSELKPLAESLSELPVASPKDNGDNLFALMLNRIWYDLCIRRAQFEAVSVYTIGQYNALAATKGFPPMSRIFLTIDEFARFKSDINWDKSSKEPGTVANLLKRLTTEGPAFGFSLIISSLRPRDIDIPAGLMSNITNRFIHRLISSDWGITGIETPDLKCGEYYLKALGVFCETTGQDSFKCSMPYIR